MKITVSAIVDAPLAAVWSAYTTPDDIEQWEGTDDDCVVKSAVDLRVGGMFTSRVDAKDGSFGFDIAGTYTRIVPERLLEYSMGERSVLVEFIAGADGVRVRCTGDAQSGDEIEPQRWGWQESLDKFARYVEARQ